MSEKAKEVTRRDFLSSSALAVPAILAGAPAVLEAAAPAPQPTAAPAILKGAARPRNVLFIGCDDLCTRIGCYGVPVVKTPNIDRMARSGVRFARNYCQYPLCCPSRTSLMTGLAPDTTRVWGNGTHFRSTIPDVVTLPQLFHRNGYFTARAGKIYHYANPVDIGTPGLDDEASWQERAYPAGYDRVRDEALVTFHTPHRAAKAHAMNDEPRLAAAMANKNGKLPWAMGGPGPSGIHISQDGRTPVLPLSQNGALGTSIASCPSTATDQTVTDYMVAESAIAMIAEHRNQPWFIGAGFFRPHVPYIVPSHYFDLYALDDIQIPPFEPGEMNVAPRIAYTDRVPNDGMSPTQHREAIRGYYAAISFVDAQVGRLLDALETMDLAQNTTIVFWADHGFMLGEHGQWQKQKLFEPSAHVPLIVAGAGVTAAASGCPRTVEHLDIYPTLVDLCGLEGAPSNLQGRSLTPLLADPSAAWDHPSLSQVIRRTSAGEPLMGYSIRTERYRYTTWGAEGEELYDYDNDPRELKNLSTDASSSAVKAKLRASLFKIAESRGMSAAPGAPAQDA